mmetsp:Transcript_21562/g.27888  ORF Transcript_21562/g.27888 Transcript_21562/m.27888 type:complete len:107 (+) Transcript_21562:89-409(+)
MYVNQMKRSKSFRYGCRRYVRGALHKSLPTGMFVIDAYIHGDVNLAITIRDSFGRPQEMSHVQIADLSTEKETLQVITVGSNLLKHRPGNARQHTGDKGKMFGLGE